MSRILAWFGCFILLAAAPAVGAAAVRFVRPGLEGVGAGAYRADRFELRLKPVAALTVRALSPPAARAALRGERPVLASLGLAVLDQVAASVGVVSFEPEFRGEVPPAAGEARADFTAFYLATLAPDANVEQTLAALRALPEVQSADPIAVLPVSLVPNDSLFASSWWFGGPPGINAPQAWNLSAGDPSTIIAILDTGVLPSHPDLGGTIAGSSGQFWTNTAEENGTPGVDDDHNGFIDDVHGWDFVNLSGPGGVTPGEDWQYEDSDPKDFAGHGTLLAGLAGAITNNTIGVAGTAFRSPIMPLRVGWSAAGASLGVVDMSYVAQAILYATRAGARVLNCSFQTVNQDGLFAAADEATRAGALLVTAAGNGDPCPIQGSDCHELADREDVLAVGALDPAGQVASFSNTGDFVDVFAPGVGIQSTFLYRVPGDTVAVPAYSPPIDGTSFSAPLAAGVAAMVLADERAHQRPPLRPMELLFRLRENADAMGATSLRSVPDATRAASGGVGQLNAARSISNSQVSFAVRAGSQTTGAAVGLLTTGSTRIAVYATRDSALVYLSSRGDTLRRVALGAGVIDSPASADLGNGGGVGVFVALDNATVAGFDGYGNALTGWPVATDASDTPAFGPSLGDVDGDGSIEVVCGTSLGLVYVWHADGSRLAPFPATTDDSPPVGTAALADLDFIPGLEIVTATQGGRLYTFHNDPTTPLRAGWPKNVGVVRAPIVLRLGRQGPFAIVIAGFTVRAFSATGSVIFSKPLTGSPADDPLAADVTGDGVDEILVPTAGPDAIAAFDSTGIALASWTVTLPSPLAGPPLVRVTSPFDAASVTALVSNGSHLLAFAPDGSAHGEYPKPGSPGYVSTLFDLGGDTHERVLAGTGPDSLIYFYLPPGPPDALDGAKSWTTARGNFARTASRIGAPARGQVNNVPARVTDLLVASVTDTSVTLGWTATGDDSVTGRPLEYQFSAVPVTKGGLHGAALLQWIVPATVDAGGHETATLPDLEAGTSYLFALIARDAQGETSLPSNGVLATTTNAPVGLPTPLDGVRGPAVVSLAQPARLPATIFWKAATPGMTRQSLSIYDLAGRLRRRFDLGSGTEGTVVWDGADRSGEPLESGVFFLRLSSGSANAGARIVLVK